MISRKVATTSAFGIASAAGKKDGDDDEEEDEGAVDTTDNISHSEAFTIKVLKLVESACGEQNFSKTHEEIPNSSLQKVNGGFSV